MTLPEPIADDDLAQAERDLLYMMEQEKRRYARALAPLVAQLARVRLRRRELGQVPDDTVPSIRLPGA